MIACWWLRLFFATNTNILYLRWHRFYAYRVKGSVVGREVSEKSANEMWFKRRTRPHSFSHFNIITCNWNLAQSTSRFHMRRVRWAPTTPMLGLFHLLPTSDVAGVHLHLEFKMQILMLCVCGVDTRNGRCQWITYRTLFDKRCWGEVSYMLSNRSVECVCGVMLGTDSRYQSNLVYHDSIWTSARTKTTTDFSFIRKYGYLHCPHRTWLHLSFELTARFEWPWTALHCTERAHTHTNCSFCSYL